MCKVAGDLGGVLEKIDQTNMVRQSPSKRRRERRVREDPSLAHCQEVQEGENGPYDIHITDYGPETMQCWGC